MINRFFLLLDISIIFAVLTAMPPAAHAYLDATTLALVGQGVAAIIMGGLLFFRRFIGHFMQMIGIGKKQASSVAEEPTPDPIEKHKAEG